MSLESERYEKKTDLAWEGDLFIFIHPFTGRVAEIVGDAVPSLDGADVAGCQGFAGGAVFKIDRVSEIVIDRQLEGGENVKVGKPNRRNALVDYCGMHTMNSQ